MGRTAALGLALALLSGALVDLRLDGQSLIDDVRQIDGWDWATGAHREIRFHGRTCDRVRAATGGSRLVAAFGCPAPVPP